MYVDPTGDFIFTFLLVPVGLAPLGMMIDGACWNATFNAVRQGINIAAGNQEKFNWAEFGGAAIGGFVAGGMAAAAPAFTVTSTSFLKNFPKYLGKAGYAALTASVSRGTTLLLTDAFTKDKEITREDWKRYGIEMGIAGGTAFLTSFTKSMINYGTWDRHSTDKKMEMWICLSSLQIF
jgi:hypothetical protein